MKTTNLTAAAQQITDDQDFQLTLNPKNKAGVTKPYSSVTFSVAGSSSSNPPLGQLSATAPDPTTGALPKYITNGDEVVSIICTMEADPTPGVNTLVETMQLTIVPSEDADPGLGGTAVAKA